ncbi:hypothetical protein [Streptomyces sp. CYG20]|uniref:hypothetical protein n=1 Tax=Streptomyces sp. CYG20 TaxID=2838873 RepID=UPI002037646E|nr:hypothetical protein [Streptomyces sp. CYG20]
MKLMTATVIGSFSRSRNWALTAPWTGRTAPARMPRPSQAARPAPEVLGAPAGAARLLAADDHDDADEDGHGAQRDADGQVLAGDAEQAEEVQGE